jgi:16S rRNA (cytidine1402-2'-O)-methyltransferase
MASGVLHVIGMPIGNKDDISQRSIDVIKNAKRIVVEQESIFRHNCRHLYNINMQDDVEIIEIVYTKELDHELDKIDMLIDLLKNGEDIFLVSDEGMPGIADPGGHLIKAAIRNNIRVTSSPGPSSIMAAITVAGCDNGFSFEGFLPFNEQHRMHSWEINKTKEKPMMFLLQNKEMNTDPNVSGNFSSHIFDFLKEAIDALGNKRQAVLCYNLTQNNEEIFRGTLKELYEKLSTMPRIDGNCCIVIYGTDGSIR